MILLSIYQGSRTTGWVLLESVPGALPRLVRHGNMPTLEFVDWVRGQQAAAEHVGHDGTGMSAGSGVSETCIGQRIEEILRPVPIEKVPVEKVRQFKIHLCGRATAKDSHVRQALIDRWGGDLKAIGGKRCLTCKGKGWRGRGRPPCDACRGEGWEVRPGPLYGVSNHAWSALAAGVYYCEGSHEHLP